MNRKQTAEEQIAKMHHLMNFGLNENTTKNSKPVVEFKRKAANGKTYGIIRESTKYYIMEAPQKDTEVLAEDFQYIGGFNNRKENEYSSYAKASNALDLKIIGINETVNKKDRVMIEAPKPKADWETNITEGMRKEIDRFKSLTENINKILKEDKGIGETPSVAKKVPEAPASNPSENEKLQPYEVMHSGIHDGTKDFNKENHKHQTAGSPFYKKTSANMQSDKNPKGNGDETYSEKPQGDYGITTKNLEGKGKVVRVNENDNKIRLRLTEEQVLAWNRNKDYMDKGHGTRVGSSKPYEFELGEESNQTEAPTDPIHEGSGSSVVYDHPLDQGSPRPGTNDVETDDGDPFIEIVTEDTVGVDDVAGMEEDEVPFPEVEAPDVAPYGEEDFGNSAEARFDREYNGFEKELEKQLNPSLYLDDDDDDDDLDVEIEVPNDMVDDDDEDSHTYGHGDEGVDITDDDDEVLFEVKLNDFGKHPAYRKAPMTLPPNKEVAINGAREWDDESAQGEEPFGKQIGDSSPFDDVVDSVMESFINKKKV